jgi:hypothetical protein
MTTEVLTEPPTSQLIEGLRERDALLGWQFESYSDLTDAWTTVTILEDLTEADLREQHGQIRQLTPLVPLDTVMTLCNDDSHTAADMTTLLDTPPRESDHTAHSTQARGPSKSTRTWGQGDGDA